MKKKFINRRRKKFLDIKKILIFLIFLIPILFFFFSINTKKIINTSKNYIEKFSLIYGYNLEFIEISEIKYLDRNEILNSFNLFKNKSIFLIPFKKISSDIKKNKWIKDIRINSNYKNSIEIDIVEEIPFGIYDNNNQKLLFSSNLIILEIINDEKKYSDLITFYGKNSLNKSKILILNLDKEFYNMVDSAIYLENRRWNIVLKNKITLFLPEKEISKAIQNYKKIYASFSNKDLKQIQSIDLRLKKQAIIKYKYQND